MTTGARRGRPALGRAMAGLLLAGFIAAPVATTFGAAAHAQASAKAAVDAAKSRGEVGEQADGYLGVRASASPAVRAAVEEINAGRREVYQAAAAKSGATPEAAAGAAAVQLLARVPPGQYYRSASGAWVHK